MPLCANVDSLSKVFRLQPWFDLFCVYSLIVLVISTLMTDRCRRCLVLEENMKAQRLTENILHTNHTILWNLPEEYLDWNSQSGSFPPRSGCPLENDMVYSKVSSQEICLLCFAVSVQLCVGSVSSVAQRFLLDSCCQNRQWHQRSGHL